MSLLGNTFIDLDSDNILKISTNSTSKGNQEKFYKEDTDEYIKLPFYYQNRYWKDYMVEHLAWRLSTFFNERRFSVVKQNIVKTSYDTYASISKNFMPNESEFVSFSRMMKLDNQNSC